MVIDHQNQSRKLLFQSRGVFLGVVVLIIRTSVWIRFWMNYHNFSDFLKDKMILLYMAMNLIQILNPCAVGT